MARPPLTRRQQQILEFIRHYARDEGISPTLEEIATHFGVNKVTIFGHVAELQRKGMVSRAARGVSRGLRVVEPQERASRTAVSIVGSIAAGQPLEAIEVPESFALEELLPRGADVYALRVRGDSMIEDGIRDGDVVLVEKRSTAHNGQTVVAVLPDEEATLKRFYREPDGSVRLEPANAALQPIRVPRVDVRGVVVGVVRRY